jgi:hypothetical protein
LIRSKQSNQFEKAMNHSNNNSERKGPEDSEQKVHPHHEVDVQSPVSIHMARLRQHSMIRSGPTCLATLIMSMRVRQGLCVMNTASNVTLMQRELRAYIQQRALIRQARAKALVPRVAAAGVLPPVLTCLNQHCQQYQLQSHHIHPKSLVA